MGEQQAGSPQELIGEKPGSMDWAKPAGAAGGAGEAPAAAPVIENVDWAKEGLSPKPEKSAPEPPIGERPGSMDWAEVKSAAEIQGGNAAAGRASVIEQAQAAVAAALPDKPVVAETVVAPEALAAAEPAAKKGGWRATMDRFLRRR